MTSSPIAPKSYSLQIEHWIYAACVLEATAPKPGNVHPHASFVDLKYEDFLASAAAVAPILARATESGVGPVILQSIQATRKVTSANTNLGIVLLLAPLAAVPQDVSLANGIGPVLRALTQADAQHAYEAIRQAKAGGLATKAVQDIRDEPTVTLLEAMRLAADYDSIAAEYVHDFSLVLTRGLRILAAADDFNTNWREVIVRLQLSLMALEADTLIVRKCDAETAETASRLAREVLEAGLQTPSGKQLLNEFDKWLRADGHRRNPGTTADLVCACLFAAFREGVLSVPELP